MILADKLKGAGGVGALQASYVGGYARSDATGYTTPHSFTSSFGDAASNRYILVSIMDYPGHLTVTGVTIGGVSATIISAYGDGTTTLQSTFAIAAVPSGTSGTVSISTSSTTLLSAAVYRLVGLKSTTPTSVTKQALTTYTTGSSGTVNVSGTAGGYIFAGFLNGSSDTEVHGAHGFGATATAGTYGVNWTVSTGTALAGDVTQTRNDYLRTLSSNSAGGMHIIALR